MKTCFLLCRLLVAGSMILLNSGCAQNGADKDNEEQEVDPDAPPPPSPYTLSINLNVSDQGTDMDAQSFTNNFFSQPELLGSSHFQAMVYVLAVNINVAAQLFVPVALLKSATGAIPSLTAADTWTYSYTVTHNNRIWTANLVGSKISDAAASWQMRVSSDPTDGNGCCTSFLFFEGLSSTTGSGSWQIYDMTRPSDSAKLFSVTYDYTSPTDKVLLFLVNSDKSASSRFGNGSQLRYQISQNTIAMEIQDSSDPGKRLIEWNRETKAGSHTDPQGNRLCWDTSAANLADRSCE